MVIEKLFNNPIFPQFVPEQGWNLGEEAWNKASMHVLFVFPANPLVRCVSQTHSVLYSILKAKYGDDVFVDISFMPFPQQEGLYYKNYPAIVGSFSKRTWEDFDVLGISIAITMTEFAQMYKLLHLANIPIHSSDRIKDDKYPLVILGGISCLPKGSLVDTPFGEVAIETLKVNDSILTGGKEHKLSAVVATGVKPCYEITTSKGYSIKTSNNHKMKVVTPDGYLFKTTDSLTDKDWLVLDKQSCFGSVHEPLAYLIGYTLGDGWVWSKGNRVSIVVPDFELDNIKSYLEDVKQYLPWKYKIYKQHRFDWQTCDVYEIQFSGAKSYFEKYGITSGGAWKKSLPNNVNSWDEISVRELLRGLFDSDGTCSLNKYKGKNQSQKVTLTSTSFALTHKTQELLLKFGVETVIGYRKENSYFNTKLGRTFNGKECWALQIAGSMAKVFLNRIGFRLPRKLSKLQAPVTISRIDSLVPMPLKPLADLYSSDNDFRKFIRENHLDSARKTFNQSGPAEKRGRWLTVTNLKDILEYPNLGDELRDLIASSMRYAVDRVDTVTYLGEEEMYDISVDSPEHEFTSGRFVTHNCDNSSAFDKVVDLYTYGLGERQLPKFFDVCLEGQKLYGSIRKAKGWIQTVAPLKVQGVYNPANYHYHWNNVGGHIESYYDGADENYPTLVKPDVAIPMDYIYVRDTNRKWSFPGNQRKASITSSLGCSGAGTCNFCHESSLYASWRERPYEKMVEGLQVAKKTSMGETFSYESFNHNFVSDFPGSLKLAYKYFDRISVINFRLDALAASIRNDGEYNYLRLLKELGTISVSGAVEGFGQRVRDCIMNKNLSFDDWLTVEREAFRMKFIRVKNGFVLSGFETKDDWKEAADEVRQIMDARDQMNSNSIYMMSCTKLVHNAGTPLYYKPRIMSYVNWQESFNPDFYYYPFMPFVDMGVKMHLCSGKGDTFVQQLLQDLPADLAEEIILKPALVYPVMSADYLKAVKSAMERYDIDPKEQFLHFNVKYHPHQHQRISNNDKVVQEEGPDKYFTHGHPQCLKTPALVSKGITPKCKSCGACEEVDAVCKEEGITEDIQGFKNHKAWTLTRPLQTKYDIADIKTVKLANAPSFWYTFAMLYTEKGRLISKENLLRQWWKKVAEKAPEQAENFRRFGYYTAKYLDYDSLASNYYGYDMVTVGFRDRLPADIEEAFKYANENCEGIQYISWSPDQTVGRPNYKILVELEFNLPLEDLQKVIDIYSKEDFRIYSETLQYPEMVSFPFDYKFLRTKTGTYKMYLIMPPLANPAYSLMCNWNFNDLQKIVKSMRVRSILNPTEEGQYLDVITHKNVNTSGFIHIDKALVEKEEIDDDAPEAEGA